MLVMSIQVESYVPTAPAHETLKDDITKSHKRQKKPFNYMPGWHHIAILIGYLSSRSIHIAACCDIIKQVGAYENIKDPKEEEKGKDLPCSLWFELSPQGSPGTDGDSLDHTEETGGADGEATGNSSQINHSFTTCITQNIFEMKICGYVSDPCSTKNDYI
ncbi:hypothetical protein STEG23_011466 [Scotinomys teguina]